ncbi:MAG: 5'(3')-deoxyribonucleotidase [Spirosomataceae bacterium]
MKRIAIDMDDVMADANGRFCEYALERLNIDLTERMRLPNFSWEHAFPEHHKTIRSWVYEPDFFRGMKVKADAQGVIQRLQTQYEVFIVSAAVEFPLSMKEKLEWMQEHFPFINWRFIVFCGHKYMVKADYLIDDHEKNLKAFREGQPLLFTAPHNLHINGYTRVNNWKEVEALLLTKV